MRHPSDVTDSIDVDADRGCRGAPPLDHTATPNNRTSVRYQDFPSNVHASPQRGQGDALGRQAVLVMLLDGDTCAARRVAAVLTPALAENVRVHVVAPKRNAAKQALMSRLRTRCARSWVTPPLADDEPIVVIEPASDREVTMSAQLASSTEVLAHVPSGCPVGSSPPVPLSHVARGYAEAVRAIRTQPTADVCANATDPALLLPPEASHWAAHLLAPLVRHAPKRTSSPDSVDLFNTLRVWLDGPQHAGKRLYVHRNTIARRLTRIQDLLHMDLSVLAARTQLAVALALFDPITSNALPGPDPSAASFDDLLATPALQDWAVERLRVLASVGGSGDPVHTVGTWLAHGARSSPTANALGISATALRKRFDRIGAALGGEDFRRPATQHSWWLAFMAYAPEWRRDGPVTQTEPTATATSSRPRSHGGVGTEETIFLTPQSPEAAPYDVDGRKQRRQA